MSILSRSNRCIEKTHLGAFVILLAVLACSTAAPAQNEEISKRLEGFDQYMDKILKDWNAPGVTVGVVAKDKLVFAKGYGYRDYGRKLPMTADTMFQIASNTKLFTAVAVMSLDAGEVAFTRRPTTLDPKLAQQLIGTYETPTGGKFQVVGKDEGGLFLVFSGQQPEKLMAYKGLQFRIRRFSDFIFEFVMDNGQVTALKQKSPVGEYTFPRR